MRKPNYDDGTEVSEAVGAATAAPQAGLTGTAIEQAMAAAVEAAYAEAERVSNRRNITDEEKARLTAEITNPEELKRRMLAARDKVRSAVQE